MNVRSIGDVGQSNDVNIFDVFHTKKLQKERSAKRFERLDPSVNELKLIEFFLVETTQRLSIM